MPTRSQLNVNMKASLLSKVKILARQRGLTIADLISDLVEKELESAGSSNLNYSEDLVERINILEKELLRVKESCPGQEKVEIEPFTNEQAQNCTYFMRAVFKRYIEKKSIKSQSEAWHNFLPHVEKQKSWSANLTPKLREALLFEEPTFFTAHELNKISKNKTCPCPIWNGIKSWTGTKRMPSQEEICQKGESLASSLWT